MVGLKSPPPLIGLINLLPIIMIVSGSDIPRSPDLPVGKFDTIIQLVSPSTRVSVVAEIEELEEDVLPPATKKT